MKVMTRREQEGIGAALAQMNFMIVDNQNQPVNVIMNDLITGIRDIARHTGIIAENAFFDIVYARDYLPDTAVKNANRQTGYDR